MGDQNIGNTQSFGGSMAGQFINLNGSAAGGCGSTIGHTLGNGSGNYGGYGGYPNGIGNTMSSIDNMHLTENQKREVDEHIRKFFHDPNYWRQLSYAEKQEIREIIALELKVIESQKPVPTPANTVEELKRNILSFSLFS
jgi:hypothetical protein